MIRAPTRMRDRPTVFFVLLFQTLLVNLSCVTVPPGPQTAQFGQLELKPCQLLNRESDLLCGKYAVYENRAIMSGPMIELNVIVARADGARRHPDPIFFLAGGPGQAQARMASAGEDALMRELRHDRDLIFIDQRGTGDSNNLECSLDSGNTKSDYFAELFVPEQVERCRRLLNERADLKFYTTPMAVEDLAQVRAALGYEKINLYGVSYGTLVALEYLRRYPQSVRSLALAGVATPAMKLPLQFAQGAERAMKRLLHDCAADPACAAAYPNLADDFINVLAKFESGPVAFEFRDPTRHRLEPISVTRALFVEQLRLMLYSHRTSRLIPLMVHAAAQGNWGIFAKIKARPSANPAFAVSAGVYFSVTCSESVPYITEADVAQQTGGTILGEYRTRRNQRACEEWPRGEISAEFFEPIKSPVPVLLLSGDVDPATPAEFAQEAAKQLANARHIVLRNTPHSFNSPCARELVETFIAKGNATDLDASCATRLRRPSFLSELPARFGGTH